MQPPEILKKGHAHTKGRQKEKEKEEIEEQLEEYEIVFEPSPSLEAAIRWGTSDES